MTLLIALLLAQAAPHPCMTDAQKLCAGVKPGEGRIAACLKQHKDQVSAECNAKFAEFREEGQACQADVEKLCPGTRPGPARAKCMREHKDQVSPECKAFYSKMMEHRGEMRGAMQACHGDAQKLCAGVQPGAGAIAECLKSHQSDLSPACAKSMGQ